MATDKNKRSKLPPFFLVNATMYLRNQLVKLSNKMLPSGFIMLEQSSAFLKIKSIEIAASLNISEIISDKVMPVSEIASATQCDEEGLYRIMRALAGEGIFKEYSGKRFRNTRLSYALGNSPQSVKYFILAHLSETNWDLTNALGMSVKTGENAMKLKYNMSPFEFLKNNPDNSFRFDKAMSETAELSCEIILRSFNFGKYKKIVDIGGGQGFLLSAILTKHKACQGILFDQTHVVSNPGKTLAGLVDSGRCEVVGGSFFDFIPKGGDAYILKNIIHDWSDELSIKIFKNIYDVIPQGAPLLLIETLIEPDNKPSIGKFIDLQMMIATDGGKERTAVEFENILNQAGFTIKKIHNNPTPFCVIEVVKK